MRYLVCTLFIASTLLTGVKASAQIITSFGNSDTAFGYYAGGSELEVHNNIKSASANPVMLKWNVTDYRFPVGWDTLNSGICDNLNCYSALSTSNNVFKNGNILISLPYNNTAFGDYHVVFAPNHPAVGACAWVRVLARDTVSSTSRTLTFLACATSTGAATYARSSDEVVLYPNPAREAINVIFDKNAGIKTIAVYNLIGKLTGPIYKPSGNGSARIDLEDLPTGIYFLRLMSAGGQVIATRRFTRQ